MTGHRIASLSHGYSAYCLKTNTFASLRHANDLAESPGRSWIGEKITWKIFVTWVCRGTHSSPVNLAQSQFRTCPEPSFQYTSSGATNNFFFLKEPKLHLLRLVELHAIIARCYSKNIIFIEHSNGNTKKKYWGFGLTLPTEIWDLGKVIELTLSFIKLIIKVRLLLFVFSIIFIPKEFLQSRKALNQALNRKLWQASVLCGHMAAGA